MGLYHSNNLSASMIERCFQIAVSNVAAVAVARGERDAIGDDVP